MHLYASDGLAWKFDRIESLYSSMNIRLLSLYLRSWIFLLRTWHFYIYCDNIVNPEVAPPKKANLEKNEKKRRGKNHQNQRKLTEMTMMQLTRGSKFDEF